MPTSDHTSLDDLISHLISALHASKSLHLDAVEKLVRMSLVELGQPIAASQRPRAQKPRKTRLPSQKKISPVPRELSLVADGTREPSDTGVLRGKDAAMLQRRTGHPPVPRRRLPPRRTGSRG